MITVEVNKQQYEKKDIFFQGNYIQGTGTGFIALVTKSNGDLFSCVVIKAALNEKNNGQYLEDLEKQHFIQFTGTITITSK